MIEEHGDVLAVDTFAAVNVLLQMIETRRLIVWRTLVWVCLKNATE
jgi:hypothetical protein